MRFDKLLIALLMFMAVMVTGVYVLFGSTIYGDTTTALNGGAQQGLIGAYDVDMNQSSFATIYQNATKVLGIADDQRGAVLDEEVDASLSWEGLVLGSYKAIRFVKEGFSLTGQIFTQIAEDLDIPAYWVTIGMSALLVLVLFGLIYLIFRFKPSNR